MSPCGLSDPGDAFSSVFSEDYESIIRNVNLTRANIETNLLNFTLLQTIHNSLTHDHMVNLPKIIMNFNNFCFVSYIDNFRSKRYCYENILCMSLPGQTLQQSLGFFLTATDSGQVRAGQGGRVQFTPLPFAYSKAKGK